MGGNARGGNAMEAAKEKKTVLGRVVKAVVTAILTVLLAAVFYVAVILGEPQEAESSVKPLTDQPLLQASPAITIEGEGQLNALMAVFPAPVMRAVSGSGLTLRSGTSYNAAFESGFGRILTLTYANAAGQEMTVTSIYPARALSLMGREDYHLSGAAGQTLAGLKSVRMENASTIRLHAQGEEAVYAVTVPTMESADLIAFTRSLQLFTSE